MRRSLYIFHDADAFQKNRMYKKEKHILYSLDYHCFFLFASWRYIKNAHFCFTSARHNAVININEVNISAFVASIYFRGAYFTKRGCRQILLAALHDMPNDFCRLLRRASPSAAFTAIYFPESGSASPKRAAIVEVPHYLMPSWVRARFTTYFRCDVLMPRWFTDAHNITRYS